MLIAQQIATAHPIILSRLIRYAQFHSNYPPNLFEAMARNVFTSSHPDLFLYILKQALDSESRPTDQFARAAVRSCCEWGYPRTALDLASRLEAFRGGSSLIGPSSWIDIIMSSADNQFVGLSAMS